MAICAPCRVPHGAEQCEDTPGGSVRCDPSVLLPAQDLPGGHSRGESGPGAGNTRGQRHGQRRDHRAHCGQRGEDTAMSAASAAPSGPDHGYEQALDDPADGPIEAGDLLDDPRTDAEALCLCLCSSVWSLGSGAQARGTGTFGASSGTVRRSMNNQGATSNEPTAMKLTAGLGVAATRYQTHAPIRAGYSNPGSAGRMRRHCTLGRPDCRRISATEVASSANPALL